MPWNCPVSFLKTGAGSVNQRESIDLVSGHFETGEKLPQELLDKARAAKNFQSGLGTVRQLEFSLFDMHTHLSTDALNAEKIQQLLDKVRAEVAVYKIPAEVKFQNAFSHIFAGGYAAGYFSYKWAEVLSETVSSTKKPAAILCSLFLRKAVRKKRWNCSLIFVGANRKLMRCCVIPVLPRSEFCVAKVCELKDGQAHFEIP